MKPEEVSKSIHKSMISEEKPQEAILPNPEFLSQIDIAKQYKRDYISISRQCRESVLFIADSCFYVLFDGKEKILRPSVNLARLIYQQFTNLRIELSVKEIQYKYVICEAVCFDLETNVAIKIPVYKSLLSHTGKRYSEDKISVLISKANGIALRTAVFSVVPQHLIDDLMNLAIVISANTANVEKIIDWFLSEHKIQEHQLLNYFNILSRNEFINTKLTELLGVFNGLMQGEISLNEIFPISENREATETNELKNLFDKKNN